MNHPQHLDPDRQLLVDSARRYLDRSYGFDRRARALAEPDGFSRTRWAEFAELGWLGVGRSADAGGYGAGPDQVALAQELGRALVVEPWLGVAALAAPLLQALSEDPSAPQAHTTAGALLRSLVDGRTVVALAAYEPQGRYDAFDVHTTATSSADGWLLPGRQTLVLAGAAADQLLVLARVAGQPRDTHGLSLFAVPRGAPGLTVQGLPTYDGRQTAELRLDRVAVPATALLGTEGRAWAAVDAAIDCATVMACGEAVGAMALALELTMAYLRGRRQFGRAITDNQVIRHRLVDLYVATEQARAITEAAADRLDAPADERRRAVSLAKAFVSPQGRRAGEDSVQLHGAIGMTDEYPVGHCCKRLSALANLFGDEQWHLDRLAALDRGG